MKLPDRLTLALSVAIASMGTSAYAQDAEPAEDARFELDRVVVTAQKREQNLQEVPISISVVSAEDLDRAQVNDLTSLALVNPALNFQDGFTPSATNFNIRGVASYSAEGGIQPSVSLVLDGVPYARAGEFISELADVERVEVLRGPQGTLFGRNSTGGVINITTKRPSDEFEGNVELSLTDDDETLLRGAVSGGLSTNVRGSLSGFYKDRDGHIRNIFPGNDDLGGIETWGVRGKLDVDFSEKLNVLFAVDYRDAEHGLTPAVPVIPEGFLDNVPAAGVNLRVLAQGNGDPVLGQQVISDIFTVNTDNDGSNGELQSSGISMDVTYDVSDSLTFRSISSYRDWSEAINQDVDGGPGSLANGGFGLPIILAGTNLAQNGNDENFREFENEYYSQEFRLEGTSASTSWILGFFYTHFEEAVANDLELYAPFPGVGPTLVSTILDNEVEQDAYAIFGDVTFDITENFSIFGGARWTLEEMEIDYNSNIYQIPDILGINTLNPATNTITVDTTSPFAAPAAAIIGTASEEIDEWSGRLGFLWDVSENVNIYGSASRGFVGTGADISQTGTPANAFLDPTVSEAIELGFKSRLFDNRVQLNANVYSQDVQDLQTAVILPGTVQSINLNAGDLDIQGIETDFIWILSDLFQLSGGIVYTDATVENLIIACYPGQTEATGCINGENNVDGSDAPNTPELKYSLGLNGDVPLGNLPFEGRLFVGYTWQDDVNFALTTDPLVGQDSYGLLDFSVGVVDKDGRYEVSIFGKNVTDEEFVNFASDSSGFIARRWVNTPRGAQAYYGAKFKYNF